MQPRHTSRQQVQNLLAGHAPERLLYGELVLELDLVRKALGLASDAAVPLDAEQALLRRWGHDLVTVPFSHGWGALQQPEEDDALFRLSYWREQSDLFVFALVDGPFSAVVKALGWEQTLVYVARNNEELTTLMADVVVEMGERLVLLQAAGADGFLIGDDIAYRRGPYVRPEYLRRAYFPFLALLVLAVQELGLPVLFHSDGNLWPIWEDLLNTGIDGVQGLDPYSAMSLGLARQRSDARLCLWGNLDLGWLAQPHDAGAIRAHLDQLLQPVAGTPVIFGTSSGLAPGIPLEHLDALYAAVREFPWSSQTAGRIETPAAGF